MPAVLDSSWLASGEGLRGTRPGMHGLVQDLFDRGAPPVVEVLSDHGAWGEEAVELGQRLVEEATWDEEPFGRAVFRGLPGFTYSGETLDKAVFARPGVLPADRGTFVVVLNRLGGFGSVEELLRTDPADSFARVKAGFESNVYASLRNSSDDYPAYLAVVAGPRLAKGMIPPGMVLGVWDVRGVPGLRDGEERDFYPVESPLGRAVRASLVGAVVPMVSGAGWHLPGVGVDDPRGGSLSIRKRSRLVRERTGAMRQDTGDPSDARRRLVNDIM